MTPVRFLFSPHMDLGLSATAGSLGVFAQTLIDPGSLLERLGTAGLLVAAAYWLVRYFIGQIEKKDAEARADRQEDRKEIKALIERGFEVHGRTASALRELSEAIRLRGQTDAAHDASRSRRQADR